MRLASRARVLYRNPSLRECLSLLLEEKAAGVVLERAFSNLPEPECERAFFNLIESSAGAPLLADVPGLGAASLARAQAAFELARRYAAHREARLRIGRKRELFDPPPGLQALGRIPDELRSECREWLGFVPFYREYRAGQLCLVERGARTHVNVDPGELFSRILALRPEGFFLFHNHPSGDLTPSPADLDLTRRIDRVSRQLGLRLLGHGIVSPSGETWIDRSA